MKLNDLKFITWFRSLRAKPKISPKGKLCCIDCGRRIHRHDRYQILAAKHRDCGDPKLVGQASLRVINGETVLLPPGAVMGAEMLEHREPADAQSEVR